MDKKVKNILADLIVIFIQKFMDLWSMFSITKSLVYSSTNILLGNN